MKHRGFGRWPLLRDNYFYAYYTRRLRFAAVSAAGKALIVLIVAFYPAAADSKLRRTFHTICTKTIWNINHLLFK